MCHISRFLWWCELLTLTSVAMETKPSIHCWLAWFSLLEGMVQLLFPCVSLVCQEFEQILVNSADRYFFYNSGHGNKMHFSVSLSQKQANCVVTIGNYWPCKLLFADTYAVYTTTAPHPTSLTCYYHEFINMLLFLAPVTMETKYLLDTIKCQIKQNCSLFICCRYMELQHGILCSQAV